jgi:hypothetical protein
MVATAAVALPRVFSRALKVALARTMANPRGVPQALGVAIWELSQQDSRHEEELRPWYARLGQ